MYRNARAEMIRAGLTIEKVAVEMDKTPGTICSWLSGKYPITVRNAVKFKKIVKSDMPLEVLFKSFEEVE